MLLSSCLLLVPMILATGIEAQTNNYVVKYDGPFMNLLKGIEVISDPSEKLNLSGLNLEHIYDDAFKNVSYIKILNLSNNELFWPWRADTFTSLTNLEQLDLSRNRIDVLRMSFAGLSNLKVLNLSNNLIKNLEARIFSGLTKSCVILLRGNHIYTMSTELFDDKSGTVIPPGEDDTDYYNDQVPPSLEPKSDIKICIDKDTLLSVEHYTEGEKLPSVCFIKEYYGDSILNLSLSDIEEFQKGWYKTGDLPIQTINLDSTLITNLTSEMFNDLPESITSVNVGFNDIVRLEKGIIVNQHLRKIDFMFNAIIEIENEVFINTNITTLKLSMNELTDTKFATTLPPTITELDLSLNRIAEISPESFRSSIALKVLRLDYNGITQLELGVFANLKNIKEISLIKNEIHSVTRDSSINLPDSLEVLNLRSNKLTNLKAGTFVNSPKHKLLLNNNQITNIEDGSFNLPHLQELDLRDNHLSVIDSGELKGLKNLRNLRLEYNYIMKIEEGTFKNLKSLCKLTMPVYPMKILENRTLHRLVQTEGCDFVVTDVPIEMIHGSVLTRRVNCSFNRLSESNNPLLKVLRK